MSKEPVNFRRFAEMAEGEFDTAKDFATYYVGLMDKQIQRLQRRLSVRDTAQVATLAHSMAGANVMMGMERLVSLLQALELAAEGKNHKKADAVFRRFAGAFASVRRQLTAWPGE